MWNLAGSCFFGAIVGGISYLYGKRDAGSEIMEEIREQERARDAKLRFVPRGAKIVRADVEDVERKDVGNGGEGERHTSVGGGNPEGNPEGNPGGGTEGSGPRDGKSGRDISPWTGG